MLENLEPQRVFYYFEQISKIPRGSGNEKQISDYLVSFAKTHNLDYIQDEALNVIIKKPASKGYENSPSVIIQGHMDMVCEKNASKEHDFKTDPIELIVEGDFIRANDTTLGADDGIAVAYILALLEASDINHPYIEALITTDEEAGMNGAYALDAKNLKSKFLINLDSEEEGQILVSCAGGAKATLHLPLDFEKADLHKKAYKISIRGLKGGHSGSDIDKQRANSNKLAGRILSNLTKNFEIDLVSINGGAKDNAIPREADLVILADPKNEEALKNILKELEIILKNEFKNSETDISIEMSESSKTEKVINKDIVKKIISILMLIPNGVLSMSLDIEGLVESSNNLGVLRTLENEISFLCAIRSSIGSKKENIKMQLSYLADLTSAKLEVKGEYPAWEYNKASKLRNIFSDVYKKFYNKEIEIEAIHAGLECGLFSKKITDLDIVSIGPNMQDIHTPNEKISISSIARVFDYLKAVLKEIK